MDTGSPWQDMQDNRKSSGTDDVRFRCIATSSAGSASRSATEFTLLFVMTDFDAKGYINRKPRRRRYI